MACTEQLSALGDRPRLGEAAESDELERVAS